MSKFLKTDIYYFVVYLILMCFLSSCNNEADYFKQKNTEENTKKDDPNNRSLSGVPNRKPSTTNDADQKAQKPDNKISIDQSYQEPNDTDNNDQTSSKVETADPKPQVPQATNREPKRPPPQPQVPQPTNREPENHPSQPQAPQPQAPQPTNREPENHPSQPQVPQPTNREPENHPSQPQVPQPTNREPENHPSQPQAPQPQAPQPTNREPENHPPQTQQRQSVTQSFEVSITSTIKEKRVPVKMLWIIDNSSTMTDDAALVQKGISGFVDALKEEHGIDIAVTFISCIGFKISGRACLDPEKIAHSAIDTRNIFVQSLDGLLITSALLAKDQTLNESIENTGVLRHLYKHKYYFDGLLMTKLRKIDTLKLENYFDTENVNLIVSVTDAQSALSDADFIKFLEINYGSTSSFKFYGYINPTFDRDKGHSHYQNLANKLGGHIFDITSDKETRYGTFFKNLTKTIKETTIVNTFTLNSQCSEIKSVQLNNKALLPSLSSCKDTRLSIKKKAIKDGGRITVEYYTE
ncbi:MAG: hypothetical protein OXC44_01395 [Proteobacteria bacterium]|nr:hypothetical protein [Pseudomonadota bacterium]